MDVVGDLEAHAAVAVLTPGSESTGVKVAVAAGAAIGHIVRKRLAVPAPVTDRAREGCMAIVEHESCASVVEGAAGFAKTIADVVAIRTVGAQRSDVEILVT